jgi:hypothetical protein
LVGGAWGGGRGVGGRGGLVCWGGGGVKRSTIATQCCGFGLLGSQQSSRLDLVFVDEI